MFLMLLNETIVRCEDYFLAPVSNRDTPENVFEATCLQFEGTPVKTTGFIRNELCTFLRHKNIDYAGIHLSNTGGEFILTTDNNLFRHTSRQNSPEYVFCSRKNSLTRLVKKFCRNPKNEKIIRTLGTMLFINLGAPNDDEVPMEEFEQNLLFYNTFELMNLIMTSRTEPVINLLGEHTRGPSSLVSPVESQSSNNLVNNYEEDVPVKIAKDLSDSEISNAGSSKAAKAQSEETSDEALDSLPSNDSETNIKDSTDINGETSEPADTGQKEQDGHAEEDHVTADLKIQDNTIIRPGKTDPSAEKLCENQVKEIEIDRNIKKQAEISEDITLCEGKTRKIELGEEETKTEILHHETVKEEINETEIIELPAQESNILTTESNTPETLIQLDIDHLSPEIPAIETTESNIERQPHSINESSSIVKEADSAISDGPTLVIDAEVKDQPLENEESTDGMPSVVIEIVETEEQNEKVAVNEFIAETKPKERENMQNEEISVENSMKLDIESNEGESLTGNEKTEGTKEIRPYYVATCVIEQNPGPKESPDSVINKSIEVNTNTSPDLSNEGSLDKTGINEFKTNEENTTVTDIKNEADGSKKVAVMNPDIGIGE